MAITPQVYTVNAGWGIVDLIAIFRQMFIDAGLMTDWYDSYDHNNGGTWYRHRILRLTNDATKSYGYQYLWFVFRDDNTTSRYVGLQYATGWNSSTHAPTGTRYYDYVSVSCTSYSWSDFTSLWGAGSYAYTYSFVRYTSGLNSEYTWFSGINLLFRKTAGAIPSWLDLDKAAVFSCFQIAGTSSGTTNGYRLFYFQQPYQIQRMMMVARPLTGSYAWRHITSAYTYPGINTGADVNDASAGSSTWGGAFRLPTFLSTLNPAYSSNYTPIVTGIEMYPLFDFRLPDDFGFTTVYNINPADRDQIYVTLGTEVWEILCQTASVGTNPMLFVGRTT